MNGRERTRLRKAREDGFLDARCADNQALVHAYGLWCWKLKIPLVWLERRSAHSKYGRVKLEMFTSTNRLTAGGQSGMKGVCAPGNAARWTRVSPHDACWDHVALANVRELAHAVFRAAIRPENHERYELRAGVGKERNTGKILHMASA